MRKRKERRKKRYRDAWRAVILFLSPWIIAYASGFFPITINAEEKTETVLIVCRRETDGAFLEKIVRALEYEPVVTAEMDYNPGMLEQTAYVITTSGICTEDIRQRGISAVFLGYACRESGLSVKEEKNISIGLKSGPYSEWPETEELVYCFGPEYSSEAGGLVIAGGRKSAFMIKKDKISCVPFYRESGLGAVMTGGVIAQLLNKQEAGNMYLAVDEVYPFSDLERLCGMADRLYENGIPFIVRVMPVYENLDYPAFERYAKALRYVQSRNGTILLHPPVVREGEIESEAWEIKKGRFTKALEAQKIFCVDTEYNPYLFTWEEIRNINTTQKAFGTFGFDCMFTIPVSLSEGEFEETLRQINDKWLTLKDYKQKFTDKEFQFYEMAEITDGEDFFSREKEQANYAELFDKGDKLLLMIVGGVLIIFFVLLGIGRKWYRRKFYK